MMLNQIQTRNCDGMCVEESCARPYVQYVNLMLHGMALHLAFCEEHGDQFAREGKR